jgi:tryptophan 2,3-dioxygenase
MNISENAEAILNEIEKKYASIDQKTETHLEALWSKPMTYWDYIQTDAFKYPNPKDNTS